jgi:hypothetical protein
VGNVFPNTKLGKTRHLNGSEALRPYIPETQKADPEPVQAMLEKYGMVYVKPNVGTGGFGVIKAELKKVKSKERYRFKSGMRTYTFTKFEPFYQELKRAFRGRTYLVQRGIFMLKSRNRPFDIRVMVQKNKHGVWEQTGTIGRLAQPKRIVTNYHSGGTPLPFEKLMSSHLGPKKTAVLARQLADLGLHAAKHMQTGYPRVNEIGVDVGIDQSMKPWIFEINTRPDPYIFRKLNRPAVFRRIYSLYRWNASLKRKRK